MLSCTFRYHKTLLFALLLTLAACKSDPKEPTASPEPPAAKVEEVKPAAEVVDSSKPAASFPQINTPRAFRPIKPTKPLIKPGALKFNIKPCGPEDQDCRVKRLGKVVLGGWLSLETTVDVITEKLGKPEKKSKRFEEGASGDFCENWEWPSKGVALKMSAKDQKGPISAVSSITVKAPFAEQTNRGIGVGSPEADALARYKSALDAQASKAGAKVVAGSLYGGALFYVKDGKIESIFVGAVAE